jgi:hypothetical protein
MVNPVHFKRKLRLREKFLSSVFCGAEKLHFRFDATEKCFSAEWFCVARMLVVCRVADALVSALWAE